MFLNAKKYFYAMLLLCIILLVLPIVIRQVLNEGFIVGEDSYTTLRIAQHIKDNNELPSEDDYSYGGRPYIGEYGMPLLLAFNPTLLSKILPFIFGLLSFILFYFILSEIYPEVKGMGTLLFIISPSFIYLFSTATKHTAGLLFSLFGIYLLIKRKKYFALAVFIFLGFFSYLTSLLILLCFLIYSIYKNKWNEFYIMLLGNLAAFFLQFYRVFKLGLPETFFGFADKNISTLIRLVFSDFGSKIGLSFFIFILGVIGIYYLFKEKYKYLAIYLALGIALYLSLYFNFLIYSIRLNANDFFVYFSFHCFDYFTKFTCMGQNHVI